MLLLPISEGYWITVASKLVLHTIRVYFVLRLATEARQFADFDISAFYNKRVDTPLSVY